MNTLVEKISEAQHFRKFFLHLLADDDEGMDIELVENHFMVWEHEYARLMAIFGRCQ